MRLSRRQKQLWLTWRWRSPLLRPRNIHTYSGSHIKNRFLWILLKPQTEPWLTCSFGLSQSTISNRTFVPASTMKPMSAAHNSKPLHALQRAINIGVLWVRTVMFMTEFSPKPRMCSRIWPTSHVSMYRGWGGLPLKTPSITQSHVWRSHVGLARQGWTGGPQYRLLSGQGTRAMCLGAVCLVIACVQRAGNVWVRVVRWDHVVSFRTGVPRGWMCYTML